MIYLCTAFVAGAVLSLQALINARLGAALGGPLWASTTSLVVGAAGVILVQLVLQAPLPSLGQIASLPAWAWCGGLLGAIYLTFVLISVRPLGVTTTVTLVVFGQMMASLLLDHFGVLMAAPHAITGQRLVGAGLLLAGVILVKSS